MKLAIPVMQNNGLSSPVSGHFGQTPYFLMVQMNGTEVESHEIVENPYFQAHQPGQIPQFIQSQQVNVMIAGGMGGRAIQFFEQFGIQTATGASGTAQETLEKYLKGELQGAAPCADHDHGHDCND